MIHARLTHEELRLLRRNVTRTIRVGKQPGKRTPQLGAQVQAYARQVVEDGEVVRKRESLRCVILEVQDDRGAWIVTYRAGTVEPARFLRARPGMVKLTPNPDGGDPIPDGDADYTTSVASAARGEPECVPESVQAEYAKRAETISEARRSSAVTECRAARELLTLHERLRELENSRAAADITRELRVIRQRIERAERAA